MKVMLQKWQEVGISIKLQYIKRSIYQIPSFSVDNVNSAHSPEKPQSFTANQRPVFPPTPHSPGTKRNHVNIIMFDA